VNDDGDSLIVTTTPAVQHTIGAFGALLRGNDGLASGVSLDALAAAADTD
jgi:hypothetical protein